jgi:hypothetical protein
MGPFVIDFDNRWDSFSPLFICYTSAKVCTEYGVKAR